ncbi:GntR family transcriptional regulator [Leucothrix pacifica]|uniref:GntR family transcriptional regulator n=1 Tax=Leucothrix pacifica TaxID=1247513 RepID=A0A317C0U6_9GAMM|nr:GntR family transcriptional regulator [Leucothrix pacifica]PWQ92178.1 GntR family transcriptional regulator [Leucothrix pacifica]
MAVTHRQTKTGKVKLSLTDKAYNELKRRILDNELPPGTQLMESELAELLDISRTPAREAMMRLEVEGLVEVRARHGMKVKPISVSDMNEIYALLTGLESTAAWQAAQIDHSKKTLDALRQTVKEMDDTLVNGDMKAWAAADEAFHRQLVEMSGNQRLIQIVHRLLDQSYRVRMMTLSLRPKPAKSNEDHADVVDAIVNKDAEEARRIHRIHREKAGDMLVGLLKKYNLTQL